MQRGRLGRQLARRKRRERLAGILVVLVGIAVGIVAAMALSHPKSTGATAGKTTKPSPSSSAVHSSAPVSPGSSVASSRPAHSPSPNPSKTASGGPAIPMAPLVILNNTTTPHLAEQAAARFRAAGWNVTHYDNYQNDILSTCAYYDPNSAGAQAAAEALQHEFPTIKRVAPQFAELAAWHSPIVVILVSDYQS